MGCRIPDPVPGHSPTQDTFTAEEAETLAPYFTNTDRPVFALVNLPETVKGALFARYSRSAKSLNVTFNVTLDERSNKRWVEESGGKPRVLWDQRDRRG